VEKSDPVKTWLAPTGAKPMGHDDDDDDESVSQVGNLSGNKSLKLSKKRLSTSVKVRPFNVIN
jgi:hypothetical protein